MLTIPLDNAQKLALYYQQKKKSLEESLDYLGIRYTPEQIQSAVKYDSYNYKWPPEIGSFALGRIPPSGSSMPLTLPEIPENFVRIHKAAGEKAKPFPLPETGEPSVRKKSISPVRNMPTLAEDVPRSSPQSPEFKGMASTQKPVSPINRQPLAAPEPFEFIRWKDLIPSEKLEARTSNSSPAREKTPLSSNRMFSDQIESEIKRIVSTDRKNLLASSPFTTPSQADLYASKFEKKIRRDPKRFLDASYFPRQPSYVPPPPWDPVLKMFPPMTPPISPAREKSPQRSISPVRILPDAPKRELSPRAMPVSPEITMPSSTQPMSFIGGKWVPTLPATDKPSKKTLKKRFTKAELDALEIENDRRDAEDEYRDELRSKRFPYPKDAPMFDDKVIEELVQKRFESPEQKLKREHREEIIWQEAKKKMEQSGRNAVEQGRQNLAYQKTAPERILRAFNEAFPPAPPEPYVSALDRLALSNSSSPYPWANNLSAPKDAYHDSMSTFKQRLDENLVKIQAATPEQMNQVHATQRERDAGNITPEQSNLIIGETLGVNPYTPGITPYVPAPARTSAPVQEQASPYIERENRENISGQPQWGNLSPADRRFIQYQMQLNSLPYAHQDFAPQFAEQMNMPNIPPVILNEIMNQMQNQPTRHVAVRPKRNISQNIMSSFDPNMFSPEFIPEEANGY